MRPRFAAPMLLAPLLTASMALPTLAAETPTPKSPQLAATYTLLAPSAIGMGVGLVGGGIMALSGTNSISTPLAGAMITGFLLSPMGLSAGYLYAGDKDRGLKVGLGGTGLLLGCAGLTTGLILANGMGTNAQSVGYGMAIFGMPIMLLSSTFYDLWAAQDVWQTTERKNAENLLSQ